MTAFRFLSDYAAAPELDVYEKEHLDDRVFDENYLENLRNRQLADEEIEARLEAQRRAREKDDFAREGREGIDEDERQEAEEDSDEDYFDDEDDDDEVGEDGERERRLNLDAFDCPLTEWVDEARTRREIESRFRRFLNTYYEGIENVTQWRRENEGRDGVDLRDCPYPRLNPVYKEKIRAMCGANSASLEVSYGHLGDMQSLLAIWLTDMPKKMLEIFDGVLQRVVTREFPHYGRIAKELHVRIIDLPICDKLRDLRQSDLNSLIRVSGVVTRRSSVSPQIKAHMYDCERCGLSYGPYESSTLRPMGCQSGGCANAPLKLNQHKSEYRNYQRLTLQETPGSVPPGRVPRYKEVELLGDLIDTARPGEEIDVIGIYMHTENVQALKKDKNGFPVFSTNIQANSIQKRNATANAGLSEEDKRRVKELSQDPSIAERIIKAIAPSIYGHKDVKEAIALSLFGGCAKVGGGGTHRVRGDINVLLLGDPGTAKSQCLKYAEKTAPRSVFATGKGASAVGLTAGVHKDTVTGSWALEGGALVLADQGVCLIDEFDKMNEQDRTSIHEAMEQQTISVSKAGIVASLQARCAVIAAANPIGGRYDPSYTLSENVELTDPILQRFDILCVLQDTVDPVVDEQLATFVVNSHMRSHPEFCEDDGEGQTDEDSLGSGGASGGGSAGKDNKPKNALGLPEEEGPEALDQDTLKKYLTYSRAYCRPILHNVDLEKIASLYADLRKQSAASGGVPIAVRHIESVMRMAEASAKMHLRDHVRHDDVDRAIKVMLHSFLQAQKVAVQRQLERSFRKYVNFGADTSLLLMHQLKQLVREKEHMARAKNQAVSKECVIAKSEFEKTAKDLGVYNCEPFYSSSTFKSLNFSTTEWQIIKTYV